MISIPELKRQGAIPKAWKTGTNPYRHGLQPAASVNHEQWQSLPLLLQVLYVDNASNGIHALRRFG